MHFKWPGQRRNMFELSMHVYICIYIYIERERKSHVFKYIGV